MFSSSFSISSIMGESSLDSLDSSNSNGMNCSGAMDRRSLNEHVKEEADDDNARDVNDADSCEDDHTIIKEEEDDERETVHGDNACDIDQDNERADGPKNSPNDGDGSAVSERERGDSEVVVKKEENDEDEDEDDEEDDDDADNEDSSSVSRVLRRSCRRSASSCQSSLKSENEARRQLQRSLTRILRLSPEQRTLEDRRLLRNNGDVVSRLREKEKRRQRREDRQLEWEEEPLIFQRKVTKLAEAIAKAKALVVYTGAGISTSANIPDYRGPNGVWTLLDRGQSPPKGSFLHSAKPTLTHMSLMALYRRGKLKHVVSQNCDGLHLRSGIPRHALSELHGNMFVEICKHCKPMRPFVRLFDVTQRTSKHRHLTMRRCYVCGHSLHDTIVHFGERGSLKWPINWDGASRAAQRADVILCLGSSLKVLRHYPWLWCMDRMPKDRPKVFIVNLQWTPKDSQARLKINAKCDEVMKCVMDKMGISIPVYHASNDPLLSYATPLAPQEEHTMDRPHVLQSGSNNPLVALKEDHCYAVEQDETTIARRLRPKRRRRPNTMGCLVPGGSVDYTSIEWPKDALYISYVPNFEYIEDEGSIGQDDNYCCDCCDPAKKRRRREASSDDEEEDEEEEEEEEEGEGNNNSGDEQSSNNTDYDNDSNMNENKPVVNEAEQKMENGERKVDHFYVPGWFGKGRRKRSK